MLLALALCSSAMFIPMQSEAKPETYLSELTKVMRADWPGNRTVNIVCHGHSVPAGYFVTPRVQTFDSYPHLLHRALGERFPKAVINVIVTAIGGEQSESGAERFERDVLDKHPDVVTIDYSLNDRGIGLERAKVAWSQMIESALKAKIKVILLTPTPDQSAKIDDPIDPLNQHAEQVRGLAKHYGVALVDSLNEFKGAIKGGATLSSLMSQVNHPNRAGHELVAKALDLWFP
jgi:acyl-CoA thioesterase-1